MRVLRGLYLSVVAAAVLGLQLPLLGGGGPPLGTLTLQVDGTYFDDCDPGTACFVVWCGEIHGTLTVSYVEFDGVYDVYDVTDVSWEHWIYQCGGTATGTPDVLTGSGTFSVDREPSPSGRLELDITYPSWLPNVHYDSGLVPLTSPWPNLSGLEIVNPDSATSFVIDTLATESRFVRADANIDGEFNIADPVFTLNTLFVPGSDPALCDDSADSNDDGAVDIADVIYSLSNLFAFGPPIPAPHPDCGTDPTADGLGCDQFSLCP